MNRSRIYTGFLIPAFVLTLLVLFPAVSNSQTKIVHNDVPLFMSGANVAWISFGRDIGPGTTNFTRFAEYFDSVRANGGNSMRLWLHTNGTVTPEFDANRLVIGPGANAIADLRQILDLAWERRVVLLLCLWSFDMTGTQYGQANAERSQFLLSDSAARASYMEYGLKPMVEALRGHPAIMAWEVFNEAEGMSSEHGWSGYLRVPMRTIQTFVNQVAGTVHRADPDAKVTTGAVGFLAQSDRTGIEKSMPLEQRLAAMTIEEKTALENEFEEHYGFKQTAESILSTFSVAANTNYYRNDRLIDAGGDPDGTLDFYQVHYYSWAGTSASPFHHPFSYWNLDKPLLVGEFYAQDQFGVPQNDLYRNLIDNGYAGGMTWQWINGTQQARTKEIFQDLLDAYPADVIVEQVPGTIFKFEASDDVVEIGQPVTISWSAAYGSIVTLNNVPVANQGDTVLHPTAPTDYVLETTGDVNSSQTITVNAVVADVGEPTGVLPAQYGLAQNYPNPFNPSTTIVYQVPERAFVRLSVYDVLGREVASLVNEDVPAGEYALQWDASAMMTGVYYYRIQAGDFTETRKLLLMR